MSVPAGAAVASAIDPAPPSPVAASRAPKRPFGRWSAARVIGVVLAAGNVYTSLKVGVIDGGSITAALLAFGIFGGSGARSGRPTARSRTTSRRRRRHRRRS